MTEGNSIEAKRKKQLSDGIESVASFDGTEFINAEADIVEPAKKEDDITRLLVTYKMKYLNNTSNEPRTMVVISRRLHGILKDTLMGLRSQFSLSSYIDNIIRTHLQENNDLINSSVSALAKKETIPNDL